ncbi:bactofilin family protein [Tsuneonella amylolytica]|uniref:bactofilin family protein n=1 Tax=Tsuneonella amylolytica TaxID=2338327 RepID=UPI000EA8B843|nr:polymer-forming cytoskeletal protein [Tsuneonella amylolytica]
MARQSASGSTFSVIGSDVVIKGDIEASADLHIDGRVEGDIACASLVQGEGSHIQGGITAESARIGGAVTGSIAARELVVLRSARINGDVNYDALTIEQGAEVEGRFAHRVPQQNSAPVAVAEDGEPRLTLAN